MTWGTYKGENCWKRPCCGKTWTRYKQNFRGRQPSIVCGSENSDPTGPEHQDAAILHLFLGYTDQAMLVSPFALMQPWSLSKTVTQQVGVTRKGLQGCYMKTSLTFSTFSFYTSSATDGGAVNFALAVMCSWGTHTHTYTQTDWHPQSLHFETRVGSVSFAYTTDAA